MQRNAGTKLRLLFPGLSPPLLPKWSSGFLRDGFRASPARLISGKIFAFSALRRTQSTGDLP
jgi:hypothetical protein